MTLGLALHHQQKNPPEWSMETTIGFTFFLGFRVWGGNRGMEKKMETTIVFYIGTTIRIHSSEPKASLGSGV